MPQAQVNRPQLTPPISVSEAWMLSHSTDLGKIHPRRSRFARGFALGVAVSCTSYLFGFFLIWMLT